MATKVTRWRPDTCGCVLDYAWDDTAPGDQRTLTISQIVQSCPYHVDQTTPEDHWNVVLTENRHKNAVVNYVRGMFPGKEVQWGWDPQRNLTITVAGISPEQTSDLETLLREVVDKGVFQPPPLTDLTPRLPQDRSLRRHLYLDGLRYAVNMSSLAYSRLKTLLASISDTRKPAPSEFTSAFLDAWSIVDSVYRYRGILTSMPGIKQNEPPMTLFLQKTDPLENLRHYMQHPNTTDHFQKLKDSTRPFLGVLSWVRIYSQESMRMCSLVAGSFPYKEGTIPAVNPLGKTVAAPVDLVWLHVASSQISLSDLLRVVTENYGGISQHTEVGSLSDVFMSADLSCRGE